MRKISSLLFALSLVLIANQAIAKMVSHKQESFADIIEELLPSVVNISTTTRIVEEQGQFSMPRTPQGAPFENYFPPYNKENESNNSDNSLYSLGSGFVISDDGYIVTNTHVIENADVIEVKFSDATTAKASIIGTDIKSDLALLKVDIDTKLSPVSFGNSDKARVGDWALAIGNPFGLGGSVSAGIISARGRDIEDAGYTNYIQTDAAINKGNSGGPLFDRLGKLIGINTAIFSNSGGNIGIGFAIPSNTANPIIEQLKAEGHVTRGWLGVSIQLITDDMAKVIGLKKTYGAYVINVTPDSPAFYANIQNDDIIIAFNGQEINNVRDLPKIVGNTKVGTKAKVRLLRYKDDKYVLKTVKVEIGKYEEQDKTIANNNSEEEEFLPQIESIIGINIVTINDDIRSSYNIPKETSTGVMVIDFEEGSKASIQGIEIGDVIVSADQKKITDILSFKEAINQATTKGSSMILIRITRSEGSFVIPIDISSFTPHSPTSIE